MSLNIRYRLIQILEILLWLGGAVGLSNVARRAWGARDQGWRAMMDLAAPGLMAVGALMAALIVLIGIYHNSRRNADALERLARQGAGTLRRLPGAARPEAAQVPQTALPQAAAASQAVPAPAPVFSPTPQPVPAPAPAPPAAMSDDAPHFPPAPQIRTAAAPPPEPAAPQGPPPVLRGCGRRLGPAS